MIGCSSRNSAIASAQRLENQSSVTISSQFESSLAAIQSESSVTSAVTGYCKLDCVLDEENKQTESESHSVNGKRIVELTNANQESLGDKTVSLQQFAGGKFEEYNSGFSKNLVPLNNAVGQQTLKDLEFSRSLADITISENSNTIRLTPMKSFDSNKLPSITSEFGFYPASNIASSCREVANACQTDNMFEDAFNLDEFMFGNQANQPMLVKYQSSYQTGSQQNHLVPTDLTTVRNAQHLMEGVDQNRDFLQHFFNDQDNMTKVDFHSDMHEPPPPYNEIRNRTFSDLLCYDSTGVSAEDGAVSNFTNLFEVGRTRDYSVSSDSGVGSSILMDSSSSPPSNNGSDTCASTDSKRPGSVTFESTEDIKNRRKQSKNDGRLSSNASECSRKLSEDANGDFITDELSPSADDPVSPDGAEKVSSKKTAYNEKWGVKVLKAWCVEMNVQQDFEKQSAEELNNLLSRFWTEVRKSNGDYYGRNSLFNLRAMINKHLKGKPYCVPYDIVTDERFRSSNDRLEKQLKMLKGMGKTITHKQPISIADLRKMYDSSVLGTSNPLSLLRKVWFEITLHFCHKGAESQEKLLKTSFQVFRDHNFRTYISRTTCEKISGDNDEIRMYETGGELCPVQSFQLYMRKLHPLQSRLFQQPRRKSTPVSPMWYGKAPIGEKALQQMMANISVAAKLSTRYTNHCVRTTALEQFSNCRKRNINKSESMPHAASRTRGPLHHNHEGYSTQSTVSNGYGHQQQQMNYNHKVTLPSYPEMTHQHQQLGDQYQYSIGEAQSSFVQMNVPNESNEVGTLLPAPSPIRPSKPNSNIRPDGRSQCYKRSMSVAFPESDNHRHYHHHPPPPYVSEAKRSKTDSENLYHLPPHHGAVQNDSRYHTDLNGLDNVSHDSSAMHHISMGNNSQLVNNGYQQHFSGECNNGIRKMMTETIVASEIMADGSVPGSNCSIMSQGGENNFLLKHSNAGSNYGVMLEYS